RYGPPGGVDVFSGRISCTRWNLRRSPLTRGGEDIWLRAPRQTLRGFPAGCTVNLCTFPKGFPVPPVGECGENRGGGCLRGQPPSLSATIGETWFVHRRLFMARCPAPTAEPPWTLVTPLAGTAG